VSVGRGPIAGPNLWRMHPRKRKGKSMLTRMMTILLPGIVPGGYLAIVFATVLLAAAAPAMAQRSSATVYPWRLGNFGPSGASIGYAYPGAQNFARPVDPYQAPSTATQTPALAVPNTIFPNSNGLGER
jgi:hypothetical protein